MPLNPPPREDTQRASPPKHPRGPGKRHPTHLAARRVPTHSRAPSPANPCALPRPQRHPTSHRVFHHAHHRGDRPPPRAASRHSASFAPPTLHPANDGALHMLITPPRARPQPRPAPFTDARSAPELCACAGSRPRFQGKRGAGLQFRDWCARVCAVTPRPGLSRRPVPEVAAPSRELAPLAPPQDPAGCPPLRWTVGGLRTMVAPPKGSGYSAAGPRTGPGTGIQDSGGGLRVRVREADWLSEALRTGPTALPACTQHSLVSVVLTASRHPHSSLPTKDFLCRPALRRGSFPHLHQSTSLGIPKRARVALPHDASSALPPVPGFSLFSTCCSAGSLCICFPSSSLVSTTK